jgi:hypothetical protein
MKLDIDCYLTKASVLIMPDKDAGTPRVFLIRHGMSHYHLLILAESALYIVDVAECYHIHSCLIEDQGRQNGLFPDAIPAEAIFH